MEAIKKVLVTGASGLLGGDLVSVLSKDFQVTGLSKTRSIVSGPDKVEELLCDLSKEESIDKVISLGPQVIVHAAALSNVDYCQLHPQEAKKNNLVATANLVVAAKELDCKFIYLSTDHVFDGTKKSAYNEEDKPNPVNVYGASKLEAEGVVQRDLKEFIILRVSWLFGNPRIGFLNFVLESAKKDKPIRIVFDKRSSPTSTLDLSFALKQLIESQKAWGEILHFTNSGGGCSWLEYAKEILRSRGIKNKELEPITLKELGLSAARPKNSCLDNSKFKKIYDRNIRTWQEALKECLETKITTKEVKQ